MLLENKVLLITGASRGIGAAVAVELAKQGADVAINSYAGGDAAMVLRDVANGDKDQTIHDDVNGISVGRRTGYSWGIASPQRVLDAYAVWAGRSSAGSGTGKWREAVVLIKPAR